MRILNFGSLNIDYVYSVDSIVKPGETLRAKDRQVFCGGKGLNQSIALAHAEAEVYHAGIIGQDGTMLLDALRGAGVNTDLIKMVEGDSSHTVIQVDSSGQNSILFFADDNLDVTGDFIQEVIGQFNQGEYLLLQNEVANTSLIMEKAHKQGMKIVFNPSPIQEEVKHYPLHLVDVFLVNEIEGSMLSDLSEPDEILSALMEKYQNAHIVLTLGEQGALYGHRGERIFQPAYPAKAVDTTAAGDTFTGFFLAAYLKGSAVKDALELAAKASAISVSRKGAAPSIPKLSEIV
ncbi:MAG: ribokinase [Caldicoprobacterales bacterium]|jgi:ribokinase|nr:ribokinase [Clostridiales bacterium]